MVAPRAHVFRPLVKGNEALGTRLVPRVFVPYCAWLDKTNDKTFVPDRWSMGTKTLGTRVGMGGHISQKWYEFTTGEPEIDRYG